MEARLLIDNTNDLGSDTGASPTSSAAASSARGTVAYSAVLEYPRAFTSHSSRGAPLVTYTRNASLNRHSCVPIPIVSSSSGCATTIIALLSIVLRSARSSKIAAAAALAVIPRSPAGVPIPLQGSAAEFGKFCLDQRGAC